MLRVTKSPNPSNSFNPSTLLTPTPEGSAEALESGVGVLDERRAEAADGSSFIDSFMLVAFSVCKGVCLQSVEERVRGSILDDVM